MLHKTLLRLALVLSLAWFQMPAHAATAPDETGGAHTPLLWRLSEGGGTVYLLGSFHLLREADYPLAPEIEMALEDAERVVFEVAPSDMSSPSAARITRELASLGDGARLRELVPPALLGKLEAQLAERGYSLSGMDRFEPWFVNLLLTLGISQSAGYSSQHGLDRHLMARATAGRKETIGLETIEAQMRALKGAPLDEQLATMKSLLDAPDAVRTAFDRLHAAWRSGDIEALDTLSRRKMQQASPESYARVNTERNMKWLPAIRELLARPAGEDALVVVGSMHLVGEDGLVHLLQRHGLAAERIADRPVDTRVAANGH